MHKGGFNRRTVLTATTALGAAGLLPRRALAQGGTPSPGRRPAATLPARGEFVVRGAHVLTMDDALGELPSGDVHVRDGAIVAVAANVPAPGAYVIDGHGMICMPGFVDTHWHHVDQRPAGRSCAQDDPNRSVFPGHLRSSGLHYTPEDSYRSVRLGLAEALTAGITTTHNWAHNVRSPAHADAEVRAMRDSGIRGRFAYGNPPAMPNDKPMDLADLARAEARRRRKDGMLTLGICSRNVDNANAGTRGTVDLRRWRRRNGARRASWACRSRCIPRAWARIPILDKTGLLGPDVQLVHPLKTSAEDQRRYGQECA